MPLYELLQSVFRLLKGFEILEVKLVSGPFGSIYILSDYVILLVRYVNVLLPSTALQRGYL